MKKKYRDDEKMENQKTIIIGILVAVIIIIGAATAYSVMNKKPVETIKINDLNIEQDQWGIYNLKGHITPLKDFDYLEARVQIYDANGTVIGQAFSWNMLHPQKDVTIDVSKGLGAVVSGTPAYAIVSFYDSAGGKEALLNFTIKFNGTNNATKNATVNEGSSSSAVSNNNDDKSHDSNDKSNDKQYTKQDLERARSDGYWQGYDDSMSYADYGFSDNVETATDSYSSESGSTEDGSYSSHPSANTA